MKKYSSKKAATYFIIILLLIFSNAYEGQAQSRTESENQKETALLITLQMTSISKQLSNVMEPLLINLASSNNKKLTSISSNLKTSSLNVNKSKSVKPIQLVDKELILAREFSIANKKSFSTTQPSTTEKYPQARLIVIPKIKFSTTIKNQRKAFGPVLEF